MLVPQGQQKLVPRGHTSMVAGSHTIALFNHALEFCRQLGFFTQLSPFNTQFLLTKMLHANSCCALSAIGKHDGIAHALPIHSFELTSLYGMTPSPTTVKLIAFCLPLLS